MKGIGIVLILLAVALWINWGLQAGYFVPRDTAAVQARAQVAANAHDMREYMLRVQQNMEQRGMTSGYAALVFKTPEKDMGLIYDSVVRINERLEAVQNLPQDSTTYQVALDDLRGTVRELNLHADDWWTARHWYITWGSFLIFVLGVVIARSGPRGRWS